MASHKVITTDAQIDRAIKRGAALRNEPRVNSLEYRRAGLDVLILSLNDGHRRFIPREDIEGLQNATPEQIARVEIVGEGTGLHWPELDLDHYVPSLLSNIYGTKRWMAEIGKRGGLVKSAVKRTAAQANGLQGGRPKKALSAPGKASIKTRHAVKKQFSRAAS